MIRKIALIIFIINIIFLASEHASGSLEHWTAYTSTSRVRYIDYFDDSLQVVTSGGWLKIDPQTHGLSKLTKIDGLGTNDLYFILKDSSSSVWVAGYGTLIKYHDRKFTPFLFFDRDDNLLTLNCLADDDSDLWVGTSSGLALFSKKIDSGQIQDFYGRFGNFNPDPAINDLLLRGDTIWVATSVGLAVADKSNPDLLKSYLNWRTINASDFPALGSDSVKALAYFHGKVFVGTSRGAFRMDISGSDTTFTKIPTRNVISVEHMIVHGDTLAIYATGGFFIYTESGTEWNNTPALGANFSCGRFINSIHWVGQQFNGLYYGIGGDFVSFPDGGIPDNRVTALSASADGRIVGCFFNRGVAELDSSTWRPVFSQTGEWATSTLQDDSAGIWIGTWGNGAARVNADSTIIFKEDNSTLHGVPDAPSYVVAFHMAHAGQYLFMTNYATRDPSSAVAAVDMQDFSRWGSFGRDDGIPIIYLGSIDCSNESFAIASSDNGIFLYYFGHDPFDKSDDSVVNLREDNSWLGSNTVNVVKFDNEGILWAGTKFGLSRYDPGIERFVNVNLPHGFGPEVTALEFDRRGNIWIGANNGLARYDAVSHSMEVFNILNSGLSDNRIITLLIDPATNNLWAGTYSGISVLQSDIGPPTRNINDVVAFPNPYIVTGAGERLSFNYDGVATVRFYTVAGELVREMNANNPWDGKNQQGVDVAPGVYLFLITAADGSVGRGKILLLRQ